MTAAARALKVRCPACGAAVAIAAGARRLACAGCGLDAALSQVGTAPGAALVALEPDLSGQTLGAYALLDKIGAGGMGTVYRARGPHGDVAVKVLRPGLGGDRAAMRQRFARESAALRRLDHPRVVRLLDHGDSDPGDAGTSYLVTELVTGEDLAARLARARLRFPEILAIFGQVCDGVAAAHAAGVVHRDLKPANILLGDGGAKVADFGLALLGETAAVTTLTRTGVAMGTFHYLSPEQRKDAGAVDQRTDVWALGVIFYEMLTGELPVGSFAPASSLGPPGCDRRVDAIVRRALAPARADRYATVAELGAAVRALGRRSRGRLAAAVLGAAAFVVAGGMGIAAVAGSGTGTGSGTGSVTGTDAGSAALVDAALDALLDAPIDPVPFTDKPRGKAVKPIGKRGVSGKEADADEKASFPATDATPADDKEPVPKAPATTTPTTRKPEPTKGKGRIGKPVSDAKSDAVKIAP